MLRTAGVRRRRLVAALLLLLLAIGHSMRRMLEHAMAGPTCDSPADSCPVSHMQHCHSAQPASTTRGAQAAGRDSRHRRRSQAGSCLIQVHITSSSSSSSDLSEKLARGFSPWGGPIVFIVLRRNSSSHESDRNDR